MHCFHKLRRSLPLSSDKASTPAACSLASESHGSSEMGDQELEWGFEDLYALSADAALLSRACEALAAVVLQQASPTSAVKPLAVLLPGLISCSVTLPDDRQTGAESTFAISLRPPATCLPLKAMDVALSLGVFSQDDSYWGYSGACSGTLLLSFTGRAAYWQKEEAALLARQLGRTLCHAAKQAMEDSLDALNEQTAACA